MLDRSDGSLSPVSMFLPKTGTHRFIHFFSVIIKSPIFFFIHSFKFRMKQTHHRFSETLAFYRQPFVKLVSRNIIYINRLFHPRKCICVFCANVRHHLVIFIRNGIFCRYARNAVNLVINYFSLERVCCFSINFIKRINLF